MTIGGRLFGILRMALLLMALVTIGLLSALITMHFVIHGAEVKVPLLKRIVAPRPAIHEPSNRTL